MKFLLIGEVYTDVHLHSYEEDKNILRLGGIFHSARALHAHSVEYSLAYISPSYLKASISKWAQQLCATSLYHVGEINGCPNVIFISDSVEAGDQGYNDILYKQFETEMSNELIDRAFNSELPTDIILYPGKFSMDYLISNIQNYSYRLHIDCQYGVDQVIELLEKGIEIETFIISTSSKYFQDICLGSSAVLATLVDTGKVKSVLLKENRGGARYYRDSIWTGTPAFPMVTAHSVGVGDCFNSAFLSYFYAEKDVQISLRNASYSAAWYASTWKHEEYCEMINNLPSENEIKELKGIELSWETRKKQHVYIAAPDFPDVDTLWVDKLYEALQYHNFSPHRPIQENGLINGVEPDHQQLEVYNKDILLLEKCSVLVAVLLNDDPGTYVEIGWMAAKGKPTILFDPSMSARNLFLRKTVSRICFTLGEVIDAIYEYTYVHVESGEKDVQI
jgi:nucleoside 2-deoxyribosyltransferase